MHTSNLLLEARLHSHSLASSSGTGGSYNPVGRSCVLGVRCQATKGSKPPGDGRPERGCGVGHGKNSKDKFYRTLEPMEITTEYLWNDRLQPLVGYLSPEHAAQVYDALLVAFQSHEGQMRKSGEPFITHPVEVTRILAELRMDHESLIAGLLHDTVEDTDVVSFDDIDKWFGPSVRKIVEGETKFSKIRGLTAERKEGASSSQNGAAGVNGVVNGASVSNGASANNGITPPPSYAAATASAAAAADSKAMDLQQLFLSMTEEVRIIVVKLADRLHNMRTLDSMPPHKQKRIADETLSVFAPLARLLGLYSVKEELEDLAFRYSEPQAFRQYRAQLDRLCEEQQPVLQEAKKVLEDTLAKDTYLLSRVDGYAVEIRYKSLYSVYKRAKDKRVDFRDISDVAQLRVVLKERPELRSPLLYGGTSAQLCYHVIGVVHSMWAPVPGGMKDYIATPKTNGYQSLHTVVLPLGSRKLFPLEVQIRTEEMQRYAEYGIAGENWVAASKVIDFLEQAQSQQLSGASLDSVNGNGGNVVEGSGGHVNGGGNGDNRNGGNGNGGNGNGSTAVNRVNGVGNGVNGVVNGKVNGTRIVNGVSHINGVRIEGGLRGTVMGDVDGDAVYQSAVQHNSKVEQQVLMRRVNWLNSIREWQEEFLGSLTAREFVDCVTDDLLSQGVFVFTPRGEVMRLPKGATVIDFAYHVHTDVGNQMAYAKVNNQPVHASHVLQNAEVVEVITYDGPVTVSTLKRHEQWLPFARTRSARHKLSRFLSRHAALYTPAQEASDSVDTESDGDGMGDGMGDGTVDDTGVLTDSSVLAPMNAVTKLRVVCIDRAGLLAEIAQAIASSGHNIQAYSGRKDGLGRFVMEYELEGDSSKLTLMCNTIEEVNGVSDWSISSTRTLPPR